MKNKYNDDENENELFHKTHRLMKETESLLLEKKPWLYSLKVHEFLQNKSIPLAGKMAREIMLPMPRDKWYSSEVLSVIEKNCLEKKFEWPRWSHIQYVMDYTMLPAFAFLFSGYGVCGEELVPCTFFANLLLTGKIEGTEEFFPEWWVIDPIGLISDKKPECYIGIMISKEIAEDFYLERREGVHFLEAQVEKEEQKASDIFNGRVGHDSTKQRERIVLPQIIQKSPSPVVLGIKNSPKLINRKLKSIYFRWFINYEGPPPRSFAVTFEDHLYFEKYEYGCENWLERVLVECNISDRHEFDLQVSLIEAQCKIYAEQQAKKMEKRNQKELNIHYAKCMKEGIAPF